MNTEFSQPLSSAFTKRFQDKSFSDVCAKNFINIFLINLAGLIPRKQTLHGEWKW